MSRFSRFQLRRVCNAALPALSRAALEAPAGVRLGTVVGGCRDSSLFNSWQGTPRMLSSTAEVSKFKSKQPIVVVGSINVDITIHVDCLPKSGETVVSRNPRSYTVPGGKGANQAVASARLSEGTGRQVHFICQFGNDDHAHMLQQVLVDNKVDISQSFRSSALPSGKGFVFLQGDGTVSSIVVGGSNAEWSISMDSLSNLIANSSALLLQREIPEHVNEKLASIAYSAGVPVMQDVGGEDREISDSLLRRLTYITPNETELARLTGMPTSSSEEVIAAARHLQARGARSVLVTLGESGAILVGEQGGVLHQPCCDIPGGQVVDATGAGDSFRAGFAVALVDGNPLETCLQFASRAGAVAVSRAGAIPSLPSREDCEQLKDGIPKPSVCVSTTTDSGTHQDTQLLFASRLNSMKDRGDLWQGEQNVLGWIARQGTIKGLDLVDFNFPQHLEGYSPQQIREALKHARLRAGAICMRYPREMRAGAFTNPDFAIRRKAIDLTKSAGNWAQELNAGELIVWSAFDGYDYSLQVDHTAIWNHIRDAFQEICDAHPTLRVSLEFKPTDENMRFFAVPSTGAAICMVNEIDRPNMGLTIDVGHCLAAGENPGQSVAMVGREKRLFGVQLNDGYQRPGCEDGLMFGSVHPAMALEFVYWLQESKYDGHIYFDTFPRNEDPVREAEYNIRRFKSMWHSVNRLRKQGLVDCLRRHDALGVLEMLEMHRDI